jgi:nicotinamide-nucleotide amidase
MAIGVQKKLSTDIGISTTGIAGPGGGTINKPVGLVFIGIAYNNIAKAYKFNFNHNRISNKMITAQVALNLLRKNLTKLEK